MTRNARPVRKTHDVSPPLGSSRVVGRDVNDERVGVQYATGRRGVPAANNLRRWVQAALGREPGAVTVRVVGEAESAALNARYRKRRGPTNVLSFPAAPLPDGTRPLLGDLVIAAPVVTREAAVQGKVPRAHWAHMVVHGCLHLLGYDHEVDEDALRMEARERQILARLGYPDPYAVERG